MITGICLSHIHRKGPPPLRSDAPLYLSPKMKNHIQAEGVQWGTGVHAARRQHRKLSEPVDAAPVNLLRLKHE